MPRYIDADKVEKWSWQEPRYSDSINDRTDLRDFLRSLPTISPDDVRGVGKWIMLENQSKEDTDNGNYWYTCSHCSAGDLHAKVQEVPFCWKCGARMKGD